MPRKSKNTNGPEIPRFAPEKVKGSKTCIGKLSIPTCSVADLGAKISEAMEKATEAGLSPATCRGVISLYGAAE